MPTPNPTKLADAILRARGTLRYDELIVQTFAALSKTKEGLETAWKVLELADERGCTTSARSGRIYYDREIRMLGRVVAWRDSRVTTYRDLLAPGRVNLHVEATRKAATQRAEGVISEKKHRVVWGTRPAADEPRTTQAHRDERKRIFKAADVAALKAYRKRYADTTILTMVDRGKTPRHSSFRVWDINSIIQEAADQTSDRKIMTLLLEDKELKPTMVDNAVGSAIWSGNKGYEKLLALLLPHVKDVNEESFGDTLLARAVHLKRTLAVTPLLNAGAKPNDVFSTFGHRERYPFAPEEGNGPMVNAVRNGDIAILKLLLVGGGDPYGKTDKGHRVIDFAKRLGNRKVIALLLSGSKGKAPPIDMDTAIATDNVARVLELVAKEGTEDVLRLCGNKGHTEVLRAVLTSSKAKTKPAALARALWFCTINGHEANVPLLLEHGADPNGYADSTMGSVLAAAQYKNRPKLIAMLKKAGAKLRVKKEK